jgi:hypothetical protein
MWRLCMFRWARASWLSASYIDIYVKKRAGNSNIDSFGPAGVERRSFKIGVAKARSITMHDPWVEEIIKKKNFWTLTQQKGKSKVCMKFIEMKDMMARKKAKIETKFEMQLLLSVTSCHHCRFESRWRD